MMGVTYVATARTGWLESLRRLMLAEMREAWVWKRALRERAEGSLSLGDRGPGRWRRSWALRTSPPSFDPSMHRSRTTLISDSHRSRRRTERKALALYKGH